MTHKTHAMAGLCVGLYFASTGQYDALSVIGLSSIGIVGGLFPDIDLPSSQIGQTAKTPSRLAFAFTGHRGLFHAPVVYIIAFLLLSYFMPTYQVIWETFFAGCASHIVLDLFNKAGMPLLYPWKRHMHIASLKLDGVGERFARLSFVVISVFLVYKMIK